ncbi:hypothetical protein PPL_01262 [Heterostelium album PN500]|uniref:Ankyrin repeat-containing protein n=1 Tax=Heterostelium pallidum (strain ATCC 26659 / Pp 5 / PN500) TaxID=670386 RepID=D3AYK2_HETP5|nr:hypothetical protein PPL_01262 [Heterostelium album PN500]EFA86029.1 hypothetical protein PPL_01262 [Heterostelium album PN500]|eukprot:XP_020438135.1 hypothetical protein PPL_01262 [Heterostelium album PN500]
MSSMSINNNYIKEICLRKVFKNKVLLQKILKHVSEDINGHSVQDEIFLFSKRKYNHWNKAYEMINNNHIGLIVDKIKTGQYFEISSYDLSIFCIKVTDLNQFMLVYNKYRDTLFLSKDLISNACRAGNIEIVKILLNQTFPILLKRDGAFKGALLGGHIEILDYLLENGIDPVNELDEKLMDSILHHTKCQSIDWLFAKFGEDVIMYKFKTRLTQLHYNPTLRDDNVFVYRLLKKHGYTFGSKLIEPIFNGSLSLSNAMELLSYLMVNKESNHLGFASETDTNYLLSMKDSVINQFPIQESSQIDNLCYNLILLDVMHYHKFNSIDIVGKTVSRIIRIKLQLAEELNISNQTIIEDILSKIVSLSMKVDDRGNVEDETNVRKTLTLLFNHGSRNQIEYLINRMDIDRSILQVPLQECIYRCVSSLFERKDGNLAIEMVEYMKRLFIKQGLKLFRNFKEDLRNHGNSCIIYERSHQKAGSKESILYLMDNIDGWQVDIHDYDTTARFGSFIFDQLVIRGKVVEQDGSLSKQAGQIIERANDKQQLDNIVKYEGIIQVTRKQRGWGGGWRKNVLGSTIKYAPILHRMFLVDCYIGTYLYFQVQSIEFLHWLSNNAKDCLKFDAKLIQDPELIFNVLKNEPFSDLNITHFNVEELMTKIQHPDFNGIKFCETSC